MRVLFVLSLVGLPSLAAADPCPSTSSDLKASFDAAIEAFDALDLPAFERTRDLARTQLACLGGVVAPRDAAAYHRIEGLDGFASSAEDRALASFRRAHEIDPSYDLPERIAPAGHPLRVVFDRARSADPSPQDALALEADTWVDGRGTALRPRELPAVLQVRKEGEVTYTGYLQPGMGAPSGATRGTRTTRTPRERTGHGAGGDFPTRRVVAGSGAAVALAGGLALLGNSLGTRAEFRDPSTPYEDIRPLKGKANRQFFGFELLTVTAIGLGTVAALPDSAMPAWVP